MRTILFSQIFLMKIKALLKSFWESYIKLKVSSFVISINLVLLELISRPFSLCLLSIRWNQEIYAIRFKFLEEAVGIIWKTQKELQLEEILKIPNYKKNNVQFKKLQMIFLITMSNSLLKQDFFTRCTMKFSTMLLIRTPMLRLKRFVPKSILRSSIQAMH